MSAGTKTVVILTAGAFAALAGSLVGSWAGGGSDKPLGLALGLGLALTLQALVTYQVVKA